jgi:hypothetical protein
MIIKVPMYFEIEGFDQQDLSTLQRVINEIMTQHHKKLERVRPDIFNVRAEVLKSKLLFKENTKVPFNVTVRSKAEVDETLRTKK